MIWTGINEGKNKILVDCRGQQILFVKSFNDETFEVELYISSKDNKCIVSKGNLLCIKTIIPDAKLVDKE